MCNKTYLVTLKAHQFLQVVTNEISQTKTTLNKVTTKYNKNNDSFAKRSLAENRKEIKCVIST